MRQFVEIPGALLLKLADSDELPDLRAAGVTDDSAIRINRQGDIEMLQGWRLGRYWRSAWRLQKPNKKTHRPRLVVSRWALQATFPQLYWRDTMCGFVPGRLDVNMVPKLKYR